MILKNTDNTYIIDVKNIQTIDGRTEEISETARGKYYERGGKKYILYKSSHEGENYSSTVIADVNEVTIRRTGGVKSHMVFNTSKKTSSVYYMPYGNINIEIETNKLLDELTENGGTLKIVYTLVIDGERYYNDMTIKVIGDTI